jgi:hypothetical protein
MGVGKLEGEERKSKGCLLRGAREKDGNRRRRGRDGETG